MSIQLEMHRAQPCVSLRPVVHCAVKLPAPVCRPGRGRQRQSVPSRYWHIPPRTRAAGLIQWAIALKSARSIARVFM